jgi:predicted RNase H-like HicB family nuclease
MAEPRTAKVPIVVERDEDGRWCAHAYLRPGVGAHGEGDTKQAAIEDLSRALKGLLEEFGLPRDLSILSAAAGVTIDAPATDEPLPDLFTTLIERSARLGGVDLDPPPRNTHPRAADLSE